MSGNDSKRMTRRSSLGQSLGDGDGPFISMSTDEVNSTQVFLSKVSDPDADPGFVVSGVKGGMGGGGSIHWEKGGEVQLCVGVLTRRSGRPRP